MIKNISQLAPFLADEGKARGLFESIRWPNGPVCPHCDSGVKVYRLEGKSTRPGLLKCGVCRKQFTVRVGTIFEDSHLPIGKWLYAIFLMCSSKKGVSANQLSRELEIGYKTAWFMCHRVRLAMTKESLARKLSGVVEVDETYIGGHARNNMHKDYRANPPKKAVVLTLVERQTGEVRTFPVPNAKKATLVSGLRLNVEETAFIMSDSAKAYKGLHKHFALHDAVDHSKQYVRGVVHTNFAESYHSLLKRGIMGSFHHVSVEHLSRYLREFEFRWNSRNLTDGDRTEMAIKGAEGKRLTYKRPVSRKSPPKAGQPH